MPDRTRQAGIISLAEFFRFFIKTLIGILLARILNQEDYGSYRQLFLVYTSFSALLLLGVPQSLLFFLPKAQDETEQKQIITRTLNLISLLAIVFSLSLLGFRVQLALLFNNPQLTNLLLIYAIYPLFLFISQLYSSVMLGLRKAESAAKFTIFAIVCDAVLIMGTALIFRKLEYIVTAVIIAAFLQWVYVHLHLRAYKLGWLFDATGLKQQLSYSLPLGLSSIIGILSIQLDKFVISGFFTPAQFAVFSVGAMELPFIGILTNSVNSVILPAISSQNDPAAGIDIYRASIRKNALIIFPLCIFSFIYAKQIITFLYGQSYLEASLYFRIYLLSLFLRIASYGVIFQAFNKTRVILINSILVLVSNLALNLLLVRKLGMKGPALATVLVTYLSVAVYLVLIHNHLNLSLKRMFPFGQLWKTLLSALISGIAVYYIHLGSKLLLLDLLIGSIIYFGIFLGLGYLLGAILPYDFHSLRSFAVDGIKRIKK